LNFASTRISKSVNLAGYRRNPVPLIRWSLTGPRKAKPATKGGLYNRPRPGNFVMLGSSEIPPNQALSQAETAFPLTGAFAPV
jgi:hypothetical protein